MKTADKRKRAAVKNKEWEVFKKNILKDEKAKEAYDEQVFLSDVMYHIYQIRTSKNITQKQLAEKMKISQSELSRIESGKQNVSLKTFYKILSSMGRVPKAKSIKGKHAIAF